MTNNYTSKPQSLKYQYIIGIKTSELGYDSKEYVVSILDSLKRSGNFKRVIYLYANNYSKVDYMLDIDA